VLIDFGAANEFIGNATGTLVGKQSFIAPEQFRGKACPQSDIYAFGCTLHFLLTGKESIALSTSHPKSIVNTLSEEVDALVSSMTELDLHKRLVSAEAVLERLSASDQTVLV
jgi:serine/threonine-protein kinase